MTHFSLGVSLIFYGDFDESMVRNLTRAGVKTFEINASQLTRQHQRQAVRRLLAQPGPRASSMHALFGPEYDFSRLESELWQVAVSRAIESVAYAAELDIPILVFHASYEPILPEERPRRLERAIEGLTLIGQKAKSTGRRIAIEYLPRTCLGNSLGELTYLIDRLGDETFGVCLDVNHLNRRYAALPQVVRALGARLIATHISDCDELDEKHWLPGKGVLDWPRFMQALAEIDYKGPFTYECDLEGEGTPEKLARVSANFKWLETFYH
jgi:sugar phosphate isomerase/epimerase